MFNKKKEKKAELPRPAAPVTLKPCSILSVCGSGVVSSAMLAQKLKDQLKLKGWDAQILECSPVSLESTIVGKHFDLIACVSPVNAEYGIPKVNAVGMLTGLSEEQVLNECIAILEKAHP